MEETAVPLAEQMQESPGMPVWLQILNWIFNWAVTIALIVGAIFLIILLIRWMIRTFYEREGKAREIVGEGYLEEEERLDRDSFKKEKKLPFIGGTPEEKVRRIYKKTVQGACREESGLETVSYTHLDVYKRQVRIPCRRRGADQSHEEDCGAHPCGTGAVS